MSVTLSGAGQARRTPAGRTAEARGYCGDAGPARVRQAADELLDVVDGLDDDVEDEADDELSLDLVSELLLLAAGALLDEEPRLSVR
jgi:hypothetical protein